MQLSDDLDLLMLMMDDTANAAPLYRPTQYWKEYERRFLPELRRDGLRDFRRRRGSVLSSFSATDLTPSLGRVDLRASRLWYNHRIRALPGWRPLIDAVTAVLRRCGSLLPTSSDVSLPDLHESTFRLISAIGGAQGARPLEELDISLAGNPEEIFRIGSKSYTTHALNYYLRYAYCCRFFDFGRDNVIVELGSGCGKQVEIIKKLHPQTRFLLFDIPPQLYVCEQYLKTVFPGDVTSYRETREWSALPELQAGRVYVVPNWKFPLIASSHVDLFWNSASFQEMEPEVVENYLRYVRDVADAVYLQQKMSGKEIATGPGDVGVRTPTTLREYTAGLKGFQRDDLSPCLGPPLMQKFLRDYFDSFWSRMGRAERLREKSDS